jgi:tripartite-type tricarboxylate transporter receptor subunit TctC
LLWQSNVQTKEAMTTIPFGGTAPAMTALIGGQVDMMCDQTTNTTAQIEGGRVKAFAVTTAKPLSTHPVLKHYPSLQEMGMKNFNLTIWHGLYAPKGTPAAVTKMLNDALKKALKDPEFIKKNEALGALVVTDNRTDPAEHKKFVAAEMVKIKAAVDAAGKYAD